MTGDSLRIFRTSKGLEARVSTSKKLPKGCLIGSAKGFQRTSLKCVVSIKQGILGSGAAGDIGVFLLTTAALEIVRRFSVAKCPFVWRGIQALQLLCYPPLKWIQRWTPFTGLVKNMQTLSKPLLLLSIATVFSDQPESTQRTFISSNDAQASPALQLEPSSHFSTPNERSPDKVPKSLISENWLLELYKELDKQGITLPERIDEDELRRFYDVSHGEFSRLLSAVKKTIRWRQTYTLLSPQELEAWLNLVFWHGSDVKQQPCLIIRLGVACSILNSNDRRLFARAIVSQIEHGVLNLIDVEHPQLTVLMDCAGLSPFGFPVQIMRSCAVLLQDHYPNRLGSLLVTQLPPVARVVTRTLFQVLKPATRQKLRIVGEDYQEVLAQYFEALPSFLGGNCSCSKCSNSSLESMNVQTIQMIPSAELTNVVDVRLPNYNDHTHIDMNINRNGESGLRTAIMGLLMLWIFIAFIFGMYFPESLPNVYYTKSGS